MPSRLLRFWLVLASLGAAAGCLISTDDYTKSCTVALDCPKLANYRCVSANAWPQQDCGKNEQGCVCAVTFPPDPLNPSDGGDGGAGGGGGGMVDAGPPPTWCGQPGDPAALEPIRKILNLSCVGTCHGPQMGYPNAPKTFRLDYYFTPDAGPDAGADGGGPLPGAYAYRELIKIRTFDTVAPMPPTDFPLPPTAAQRSEIWNWVDAGAPYGDDSLCNPDAGVSFANDVKPIFNSRCGPCHLTTPYQGGLNLTSSSAYNSLVNVNSTCDSMRKRVLAFDAHNSLLWQKLTPDGGACGGTMPDGGAPLRVSHSSEFDTIEAWILQGAKNN